MSLSVLLGAQSGLRASQALIETATRNITNAGTEGYVRRSRSVQSVPDNLGVRLNPVQRENNLTLTREQRGAASASGFHDVRAEAAEALDRLLGDPSSGGTLSLRMEELGARLQDVATNPTRSQPYWDAVHSARDLASAIRDTYLGVDAEMRRQQAGVAADVEEANRLLERLAELNREYPAVAAKQGDATDIEDERDRVALQLSGLMEIRTFIDGRGIMQVYSSDSHLLADQSAQVLAYKPDTGVTVSSGRAGDDPDTIQSPGGRLGGRLSVIDTAESRQKPALNQLAYDLAAAFRGLEAELDPPSGDPFVALFAHESVVPPATDPPANDDTQGWADAPYAATLSVSADYLANPQLLTGPQDGIARGVKLVEKARDLLLPDAENSLVRSATEIASGIASFAAQARADAEVAGVRVTAIERLVGEASGVDIDQELGKLVFLQNSYAANARVMQTAKAMLDELLGVVR